jgi:Flp pilus assembly protein TadG
MVEFALIFPLFLLLVMGIVDGAWFVFETTDLDNAARSAARWEVAANNFDKTTDPAFPQPYCQDSPPTVQPGMLSAAEAAAGPFAAAIASGTSTAPANDGYGSDADGCTATITAPFSPLGGLIPVGPSSITASFTAFED